MLAMAIDVVIVVISYLLAVVFRFAGSLPDWTASLSRNFLLFAALAIVTHIGANWVLRVYAIVNRYIGLNQGIRLVEASVGSTALLFLLSTLWPGGQHLLPLASVGFGGLTAMVAMVCVRFYGRIFNERSLRNVQVKTRLLLVGAGYAASMIIREVRRNPRLQVQIVGLVDDDPDLQGMRIDDIPVLGGAEDIPELVREHEISEILIAIPSSSPEQMTRINQLSRPAKVPIRTLPSLSELVNQTEVSLEDAREIDILDLLGRPKVEIDLGAIGGYLRDKRVLVTGAGGSVGSELCRQISAFKPAKIVMVDHNESALYALHEEFSARGFGNYEVEVTSILQTRKMEKLFTEYAPHAVFHAAAYKHVPLMEAHPDEAVLNNVKGTLIVAEAAIRHEAQVFVNISTDKAIDPINVMGATKRLGELLITDLARGTGRTRLCSVRFGNVLGSRGSVFPIFKHQIEAGGPVTITHPDMTRYFMTIEEAVKLVLQAAALVLEPPATAPFDGPCCLFVLEMGDPVPILDLATQMLLKSFNNGNGASKQNIGVEFTGLRPGEKLEEQLFYKTEVPTPTSHPMILLAIPSNDGTVQSGNGDGLGLPHGFKENLARVIVLAEHHADADEIIPVMQAMIPTYEPFDWSQVGAFQGSEAQPRIPAEPKV